MVLTRSVMVFLGCLKFPPPAWTKDERDGRKGTTLRTQRKAQDIVGHFAAFALCLCDLCVRFYRFRSRRAALAKLLTVRYANSAHAAAST
jgi:hypothetical protein